MIFRFTAKGTVVKSVARHLLYWLLFVLFFTLVWGTYDNDYFKNLMIQVYSLPSRLILVYGTLYLLFPIFFVKKKYRGFIVSYILLLIGASLLVQRPLMFYHVQSIYLPDWESSNFLAVTELMNTILDVNIAAVIPLGYTLFKIWHKTNQKTLKLEKQQLALSRDKEFIYLKVEKSLQKVFIKDIIFIESLKNYIKVKTTNREIIAYKSITATQNSLPQKKFIRVHRSFIVGLDFIDSFSPSKIDLGGTIIPIGRKYKEIVKKELEYF